MKKTKYYTEIPSNGRGYIRVVNRRKFQLVQLQLSPDGEFEEYVPLTNVQIDLLIEALQASKDEVEE